VAQWPMTMRGIFGANVALVVKADFVRGWLMAIPFLFVKLMFVLQTSFQSFRRHCPSIPF